MKTIKMKSGDNFVALYSDLTHVWELSKIISSTKFSSFRNYLILPFQKIKKRPD